MCGRLLASFGDELDRLLLRAHADDVAHVGDHALDLGRFRVELEAPGLDARQVEQIDDQLQQVLPARLDRREPGAAALAQARIPSHDVREAEDRVERRAQLVAHAREELALRAVRAFGLETRLLIGLRLLDGGLVEHERDGLVQRAFGHCQAEQHGHARAVLAHVLLLVGRAGAALARLSHRALRHLAVFGRADGLASDAPGAQVLAVVADDAQERVVRLEHLARAHVDEHDAGEVRIDHLAQPRVAGAQRRIAALELGDALPQRAEQRAHAPGHLRERPRQDTDFVGSFGGRKRRVELGSGRSTARHARARRAAARCRA